MSSGVGNPFNQHVVKNAGAALSIASSGYEALAVFCNRVVRDPCEK